MSGHVLIAGWPGAVGAGLAEHLLRRGRGVEAVVGGTDTAAGNGAGWHHCEDPLTVARERLDRPPVAAVVLFPPPWSLRAAGVPARVAGLAAAAQAAGARRFVCWGSAAGYAHAAVPPLREGDPLGASGAEAALERAIAEGLGPGVASFLFRAVAVVGAPNDWVSRAARRRLLPVWAGATLQVLHLSDAVDVLAQALESSHPGCYNVAGDGLLRWSHAVRALGPMAVNCPRAMALRWLARVVTPPEFVAQLSRGIIVDTARLKTHFGYRPRHPARESLAAARDAACRVR